MQGEEFFEKEEKMCIQTTSRIQYISVTKLQNHIINAQVYRIID